MKPSRRQYLITVWMVLLAAALALIPAAASQIGGRSKATKSKADPPSKPLAMPFRAGETLKYRVSWATFSTAASVELAVPEQRNLYGYGTWHFRAVARTMSPVRTLFPIDDQFDSYTDATTLESRQYEMHLNELGKIDDQVFHFLPSGQTPRAPGPSVLVQPGTRDPLGALYALRRLDWDHTQEFRGPVYDGHDVYDIRATRDAASEAVKVAAGNFATTKISVAVFQHGKEMTVIHFTAWFANDSSRAPVVMQAQLPFGSLHAELLSRPQ